MIESGSMRILHAALVAIGLMSMGSGCAKDPNCTSASVPYTVLDDQGSQLRAEFNRKIGWLPPLMRQPFHFDGLDRCDRAPVSRE